MGCGASAGPKQHRLQQTQGQLQEQRRQADGREQQMQEETERLVRTVGQRNQEAALRNQEACDALRLERELLAARATHELELRSQREQMGAEHALRLRSRLEQVEREALLGEQDSEMLREDTSWRDEADAQLAEQLAQAESANTDLLRGAEQLTASAQEELFRARAEVHILMQERDSESEAVSVTKEACLAERRAAERRGEMLRAEVRTRESETEVLEDAHRGLEDKARSLQRELSKVTYTVGQRDHELKVKDSELHEVRQSLACMQGEMDEVNRQLKDQCGRVQRVEGSLRISRDLGEKVRTARTMLKESHGGLAQLCGLLEQERSKREQCAQGLKQQRIRTELLLQLLHHFKSRTQDLSPQALLGGHAGGHFEGGLQ